MAEYNKLREHNYKLVFQQPDKTATKNIENVSRKREKLGMSMTALLEQFRGTGMTTDEIIKFVAQNLRKGEDE